MQILEINTLKEHRQQHCKLKDQFKQCSRCEEPIHQKEYSRHLSLKQCRGGYIVHFYHHNGIY